MSTVTSKFTFNYNSLFCLETKLSPSLGSTLNQAKNIPVALPSFPIKIWAKSIKRFMNYDWTIQINLSFYGLLNDFAKKGTSSQWQRKMNIRKQIVWILYNCYCQCFLILNILHSCTSRLIKNILSYTEAEFKEFVPRLKYSWFHLKFY